MDFRIAVDKDNYKLINDGKTIQSHIIYIPPGHVALLSLFNMVNTAKLDGTQIVSKSCLTVKKLSFSRTGDISDGNLDLCDKTTNIVREAEKLLKSRTIKSEPVYQGCCPWFVDPSHNFSLIPTPGFYVLETDEIDQLETMYVEYAILTAEQALAIPNGFKLGNNHVM